MADYPLGRIENPYDARDQLHPFSAMLPPTPLSVLPNSKYWTSGPLKIDQGQLGACVSHAGGNWKQASPTRTRTTNAECVADYWACKQIDGLPPGTEGTYDRALMQVYQQQGRIDRYLWAQSMDELIAWLLTNGGVMVGTNWYRGMFTASASGLIRPTGDIVGGHEYFLRGVNQKQGRVKVVNSWGVNWSIRGEGWMLMEDLDRLVFRENGDACTAVEVAL